MVELFYQRKPIETGEHADVCPCDTFTMSVMSVKV